MMPKLKKNILNFGYGANFKYKGMLTHSFDRFYVVANYDNAQGGTVTVYHFYL